MITELEDTLVYHAASSGVNNWLHGPAPGDSPVPVERREVDQGIGMAAAVLFSHG